MMDENIKNKIFIIPGMPRAGTTFLYHNLQLHPEIFVPYRKEVNYFTFDHKRGEKWYFSMFDEMTDNQIGADISPFYFMDDFAPERIKKYCDVFNDNILVCNFKLLNKDPLRLLSAIEHHLGIKEFFTESNFDNLKINAGHRAHIKAFTKLTTTKIFRILAEKILPRKLILFIRRKLELISSTHKNEKNDFKDAENLNISEKYFIKDSEFYKKIFNKSDILSGRDVLKIK